MDDPRTIIVLTISPNVRDALATVSQFSGQLSSPVVIATPNARTGEPGGIADIVRSLVAPFAGAEGEVAIVTPQALARLTWQRVRERRDPSAEVDLRGRGGQLPSVRLKREIVEARTVIAVNDLRGESAARPTVALGIWGGYTDIRDRFGLRLSVADKGAAAEIALAVRPQLILLVDHWREYVVAVATSDQIAAELAGLAIKQVIKGDADEPIGPWEDPLVQRATELHLGALLPDQLAIHGVTPVGEESVSKESLRLFAGQIALKLGVATVV